MPDIRYDYSRCEICSKPLKHPRNNRYCSRRHAVIGRTVGLRIVRVLPK